MEIEKVTDIALTVGEILLANGGENYRIEESIHKICKCYNIDAEIFITSNGILLLTKNSNSNKITSMKKVKCRCVDLYKLELINSFSRDIEKNPLPYDKAKKFLNKIKDAPIFDIKIRALAASMTGFTYTIFFNGSIIDGLASTIVCLFVYILFEKITQLRFFQFLEFYLAGLFIGGLSILLHLIIPIINQHSVITGSIMILLPGVILTNGIKDILYGNFSFGITNFFEAMLIITAIGIGIVTSLFLELKGSS